jgi:hypothetical protein
MSQRGLLVHILKTGDERLLCGLLVHMLKTGDERLLRTIGVSDNRSDPPPNNVFICNTKLM